MGIVAFRKLSLIDYPGKLSAVLFYSGCNFDCVFCHNRWLLDPKGKAIRDSAILDFLRTRRGQLDGVVISGGEPTLQRFLIPLIEKIKRLGFLVKLDTNGTRPLVIKSLLNRNLLDYIAMDIKGPPEKYPVICKQRVDIKRIRQSIDLIKTSGVSYEFRTTIWEPLLNETDLLNCGRLISGASTYYLQRSRPPSGFSQISVADKKISHGKLEAIRIQLNEWVDQCYLR